MQTIITKDVEALAEVLAAGKTEKVLVSFADNLAVSMELVEFFEPANETGYAFYPVFYLWDTEEPGKPEVIGEFDTAQKVADFVTILQTVEKLHTCDLYRLAEKEGAKAALKRLANYL